MVRTRFAPSPTGFMHLGGVRTALYEYLIAKQNNGTFILRIEDTDQERFVEGATEVIYDTLRACGLNWDEGPDIGGDYGPYIQSERKATYLPYAKQLVESGHAYYCFCSKEEIDERRAAVEAAGGTWKYDKHCMHLSKEEVQQKLDAGIPWTIRMNAPTEGETSYHDMVFGDLTFQNSEAMDDMVLIKQDGMPTYNFANVIDDHLMNITHVVRGMEYLSSTPRYNYLYNAFGWDIPTYVHLPTVMRDATHKLSKRDGDAYYSDYIEKGFLTEALINYLALVGWNPGDDREFFTLDELVQAFDVKGINRAPGIFDPEKLRWFNFEYIRKLPFEDYLAKVTPWFDQVLSADRFDYRRLAELMQDRTETFADVPDKVAFLSELPEYDNELFVNKKQKSSLESSLESLKMLEPILAGLPEWTEAALHDTVIATIAERGLKNATVLWPMRIAISGLLSTPGGAFEIAYLLGRDETLARIEKAVDKLS